MGMGQTSANERLRTLQKVLGYTSQQAFADALGIKQGSLSDIYRAKNGIGVSGQIKIALSKHGVNIDWLDTGEGEMLRMAEEKAEEKPHHIESNVRPVLEGEREWVEIPLVPYRARAGVLSGFGDPDWQEGKQTMHVLVDRRLRGDYLIYEVEGDSMDDGTTNSFLEGDFLLCRVLPKSEWQYGIKKRTMTFCVIATEAEGVVLKQVTRHDKAEGVITCHSLNPAYDDYEVNLSDVQAIFYVERLAQRNL
jgi:bacteriophage CI repressor helix-turn-helix domain|nr:MAG TPA: CI repressor [Caudoviricetes sp.]